MHPIMTTRFNITLAPNGGSFECAGSETLLDAALQAGYRLPHNCRNGSCGLCELPIVSGEVCAQPSQGREAHVTAAGACLTCQSRPTSDVVLSAPGVGAVPGQQVMSLNARVSEVQRVSDDVAIVQLQLPATCGFNFEPGQYVDLILRDGTRRSYSMANAPGGGARIAGQFNAAGTTRTSHGRWSRTLAAVLPM